MIIKITASTDGFRRCGVAHSAKGQEFNADHFSEDQIEILQKEPQLMVEITPEEDDDKPPAPPKKNQGSDKELTKEKLVAAAKKAIKDGKIISSGVPSVDAMEDILGTNITAEQRNQAWVAIQKENES